MSPLEPEEPFENRVNANNLLGTLIFFLAIGGLLILGVQHNRKIHPPEFFPSPSVIRVRDWPECEIDQVVNRCVCYGVLAKDQEGYYRCGDLKG